ncbi:murein L,D-transpeptidase family protein [Candidatus Latescibacterota bacterium]
MNIIRTLIFIVLAWHLTVCFLESDITIAAEDFNASDSAALQKIASYSINTMLESTKDVKEAALRLGIKQSELIRLCKLLDIDTGIEQEIQPISQEKIIRVENDADVLFHNGGTVPYVMLVEKSSHLLFLFSFENGKRRIIKTFECKTGKNHGDKKTRGDNKTPEGIYFLKKKHSRREIERLVGKKNAYQYGDMAFVTNFPNAIDQLKGKKGSGIWLHGTDENFEETASNDTRGCVVTTNETINELDNFITPGTTPLIIVETLSYTNSDSREKRKGTALRLIDDWRLSWEKKDINTYIDYYSESFRSQGKSRNSWKSDKQVKWKRNKDLRVSLNNIIVYGFSKEIVINFKQNYSIVDGEQVLLSSEGTKTLHLVQENDTWKIITEYFQ